MTFVVEKIPEDSFYVNLLLGLPQTLSNLGIKEYTLVRCPPLSEVEIIQWERKHGVLLPEDLRTFYCSTNGLYYKWFLKLTKEDSDEDSSSADDDKSENETKPVAGAIEVNSLENLRQVFGYVTGSEYGIIIKKENVKDVKLSLESKVFEITPIVGGKVVLLYLSPKHEPSIWLLTWSMEFSYLANDFKTYLKMCIAHLGIPNWQFIFTTQGISEWTKTLFRLYASHLLPRIEKNGAVVKRSPKHGDVPCSSLNKIDISIFKTKSSKSDTFIKLEREEESPHKEIVKKDSKVSFKGQARPRGKRKPLYYVKKR